jgi:hypothetical protein
VLNGEEAVDAADHASRSRPSIRARGRRIRCGRCGR